MELKMNQFLMSDLELRGAEVDLTSWLFEDDQGSQDFCNGAKETNCLPFGGMGSTSPSVITSEDLPGWMETANLDWDESSFLDNCLSQNLQKDPCDLSELNNVTWGSFGLANDCKENIGLQSDLLQAFKNNVEIPSESSDSTSNSVPSVDMSSSTGYHYLPESPASIIDETVPKESFLYLPVSQIDNAMLNLPDSPMSDQESSNDISPALEHSFDYVNDSSSYAKIITVPISDAIPIKSKTAKSIHVKRVTIPKSQIQTILTAKNNWKKPKRVIMNMKRVSQIPASTEEKKPVLKDIISNEGDELLRHLAIPSEVKEETKPEIILNESEPMYTQEEFEDSMQLEISSGDADIGEMDVQKKRVPYSLSERKIRKKEQNKRAALRYRQKKKEEEGTVQVSLELEQKKKKQLTEEYKNLQMELKLMRKLLRDIYGQK